MRHITIRKLCIAALFTALSIVLSRFLSIQLTDWLRLGFGKLPVMLTGILLGPWWGAAAGALADIIGYFINPMGGLYLPGLTLSMALVGFIPGVIAWYVFRKLDFKTVLVSAIINSVLIGCGLTTLWLSLAYGTPYIALLPMRALNELIMSAANIVLGWAIIKAWGLSPLRAMPQPGAIK